MGRQLRCAVAVSRMYQARREAGRLFGRCERASLKVRPRIAPGPLLSKAPSTLEGMSILAAAFRTSTALGVGTDVSFTGRAGRGLALSRRNKRRAEERRNDKGRDCKFGSHQKSPRLQG